MEGDGGINRICCALIRHGLAVGSVICPARCARRLRLRFWSRWRTSLREQDISLRGHASRRERARLYCTRSFTLRTGCHYYTMYMIYKDSSPMNILPAWTWLAVVSIQSLTSEPGDVLLMNSIYGVTRLSEVSQSPES